MNRLFLACTLIVLIASTVILGSVTVHKTINTLEQEVDACCLYEQNKSSALQKTEHIKAYWHKKEKWLEFFINRNILNQIDRELELMLAYDEQIEEDDFYLACQRVQILLRQVRKDELKLF